MVRFGVGGVKKLSELMIDTDKDWNNHEILNVIPKVGYKLSDDIYWSSDDEVSTLSHDFTKVKSVRILNEDWIPKNMTLRISYAIKARSSSVTCEAYIARNGTQVGTLRSTNSTYYVTFTEDIGGWNPGDYVELWIRSVCTYNESVFARNFRILGIKSKDILGRSLS